MSFESHNVQDSAFRDAGPKNDVGVCSYRQLVAGENDHRHTIDSWEEYRA